MKSVFKRPYLVFCSLLFDPILLLNKWRGMPYFLANVIRYKRCRKSARFPLRARDFLYSSSDRFAGAGSARGHYFHQDLWAARFLFDRGVKDHVDVGSRVDGFIAHVLPFCKVSYVDIRPLCVEIDGLEFRQGSIVNMPFEDDSVLSLSCLHVIEHIGLGRYGDPIDPEGHLKSASELTRVLKPGGHLLLGTPVGRERLCFDGHRIFDPRTIVDAFCELTLNAFSLIDDTGNGIIEDASFDLARECEYGCGLFVFEKKQTGQEAT